MVFGDSGDYKPGSWPGHLQTSKLKNIKIFWICTPRCPGSRRGNDAWSAAYKGLSEGRVYETASELKSDQFFKDAVLTVGKLNLSPCTWKSYPVVTLSISGWNPLWRPSIRSFHPIRKKWWLLTFRLWRFFQPFLSTVHLNIFSTTRWNGLISIGDLWRSHSQNLCWMPSGFFIIIYYL